MASTCSAGVEKETSVLCLTCIFFALNCSQNPEREGSCLLRPRRNAHPRSRYDVRSRGFLEAGRRVDFLPVVWFVQLSVCLEFGLNFFFLSERSWLVFPSL